MYSFIFNVGIRNHNKKKYAMRYTGYTTPFIVLLLVTDDPEDWHRENLERNPAHYSALLRAWTAAGGNAPWALARLQMDSGARIFFNTLVPFEDGLIKYGVIATKDLIADLLGTGTVPNLYLDFKTNMDPTWRGVVVFFFVFPVIFLLY